MAVEKIIIIVVTRSVRTFNEGDTSEYQKRRGVQYILDP